MSEFVAVLQFHQRKVGHQFVVDERQQWLFEGGGRFLVFLFAAAGVVLHSIGHKTVLRCAAEGDGFR